MLDVMDEVYEQPLPFEDHWNTSYKICEILIYSEHILLQLDRQPDRWGGSIKYLLMIRYKEDMESFSSFLSYANHDIPSVCEHCVKDCFRSKPYDNLDKKYRLSAGRLVKIFAKILQVDGMDENDAKAIMMTKVADFIEDMISFGDNNVSSSLADLNPIDDHHVMTITLMGWRFNPIWAM